MASFLKERGLWAGRADQIDAIRYLLWRIEAAIPIGTMRKDAHYGKLVGRN